MVEDNRIDAHLTTHALKKIKEWPISIRLVEDGDKAIKFLSRDEGYRDVPTPDLIILDMNLPKRDGTEVLKFIRTQDSLKNIPVYIFSSSPADIARESTSKANVAADHYFEKPYEVGTYHSIAMQMKASYIQGATSRRVANA